MSEVWGVAVIAAAAGAGALYLRTQPDVTPQPADLDIAKSGQLFALAAEWLRADAVDSAHRLLDLIPVSAWQFAHDEVIAASPEPRINAMADRMTPAGLITARPQTNPTADRLAQVETLNLIAQAIRDRMRPAR